jgi:hypothetical protein
MRDGHGTKKFPSLWGSRRSNSWGVSSCPPGESGYRYPRDPSFHGQWSNEMARAGSLNDIIDVGCWTRPLPLNGFHIPPQHPWDLDAARCYDLLTIESQTTAHPSMMAFSHIILRRDWSPKCAIFYRTIMIASHQSPFSVLYLKSRWPSPTRSVLALAGLVIINITTTKTKQKVLLASHWRFWIVFYYLKL